MRAKACVVFLLFLFGKELYFTVKECMLFVKHKTKLHKKETEAEMKKCHTRLYRGEPCASANIRMLN